MSASEKVIEAMFLAGKENNKEYKVSTLKSNGYLPQVILANEVATALTEEIDHPSEDLASVLKKFDMAFELGITSTRSDNGWFTDILTSQRVKQQMQVSGPGQQKVNPMSALMGGARPPQQQGM